MSELTEHEARAIAAALRTLSSELGEYRFAHWKRLTEAQRGRIESLEWTLLNYSSDMTAAAISLAIADKQPAVEQVNQALQQLQGAIARAGKVEQIIDIATRTTALGAAIATGNLHVIKEAVGALKQTLQGEDDPPA